MAVLDSTAMNAALKELYDGQTVANLVYSDNPFLAMVKKMTSFGGKYLPQPIITGVSQGRSAVFATALANQSAAVVDSFLLTRAKDYSIAEIENEIMMAAATDKMSFLNGSKLLIDSAYRSLVLSLCAALFRNGTGTIGRVSGTITSGVIQLANIDDVVHFELNQTLQANATDGGTPRAALGYVVAVDRSLGVVTVSATAQGGAAGTPSGWIADDYLLVQGDVNAKIKGLDAWVPASAPGATAFFGVDRTADTTRLGGVRHDGSAQSIEEALIDISSKIAREGGKSNVAIVNYASFAALEKSLGSKVQYVDLKGPAEIGFRGIMINGANSMIKVFPDRSQKAQVAKVLQLDTWCLYSLGDAPQILKYGDGLEMLRVSDNDTGQVRLGYYAQLGCNAPGWNGHADLSA